MPAWDCSASGRWKGNDAYASVSASTTSVLAQQLLGLGLGYLALELIAAMVVVAGVVALWAFGPGRSTLGYEVTAMPNNVISRDPEILSGTPVFAGTRVPVHILFEHLEAGDRLDDFLDSYPTVSREQAVRLLELAVKQLIKADDEAAA